MAQADQTVQNASFPTVRADINSNLAALFSASSGNTAPTVTVAFQDWIDTSGANPLWKKRNAANNAWVTVATITGSTIAFEGTLPSQTGNAGEYLKTNGTVASWEPIASGLNGGDLFVSSGNWLCPAGVTKVLAIVIGGGGGGSYAAISVGSDGEYGGVGIGMISVSAGTTYSITVGAGGAGSNTTNGTAGGNSSFGSIITATGGGAGGGGAIPGTCNDAAANFMRSNISATTVPFVNRGTVTRANAGSSTAALTWSPTLAFNPGTKGEGEIGTSGNDATGGVGGVVVLIY